MSRLEKTSHLLAFFIGILVASAYFLLQHPEQPVFIEDCSAIWNGRQFVKGKPSNPLNYKKVEIVNTPHEIFLSANMNDDAMEKTMKNNIEKLKKICPIG